MCEEPNPVIKNPTKNTLENSPTLKKILAVNLNSLYQELKKNNQDQEIINTILHLTNNKFILTLIECLEKIIENEKDIKTK